MDIRWVLVAALLTAAIPAAAQMHSASGTKPRTVQSTPKAAVEGSVLQDEARRAGRPGPSDDVIALPAMGSEAARQTGRACIGGQAMRRLANGWAQESSKTGGWQRCREKL